LSNPPKARTKAKGVAIQRPEVHAGYDCDLFDRKNATSWLNFGWDYLDVLHFGGRTIAVQPNGTTTLMSSGRCDPATISGEAALISHAHTQGVKVLLAVHWNNSFGGSKTTSADALYRFLTDPAAMEASASSICSRAQEAHCDGLSLDFEVANTRFNTSFKGLFAGYIQRLSAVASKQALSVVPALFMDLPSNTGVDTKAVAAASSGGVVLMTYDYHWGGDSIAGPNAPLFGNNGSNVNDTITWALHNGTMPAADVLMGIAWYGREYPTTGPEYQAATNCSKAVPDQTAKAYQAPLALKRARTLGEGGALWDATSQTPWYKFQDPTRPYLWWEGYFDDARSLALKYELVKARSLKGVMIWMLNGCTQDEAPEMWGAPTTLRSGGAAKRNAPPNPPQDPRSRPPSCTSIDSSSQNLAVSGRL
jgi:spore germination protein YaaH